MKYAHITTLPTYHKYLKELQELGYRYPNEIWTIS